MKLLNNEFWFIVSLPDEPGDEPVIDSIWETEEEVEKYLEDNRCLYYELVKGAFGHPVDLAYN